MDEILDAKDLRQPPQQPYGGGQKQLPNGTAILVLGIISIATACMYGVPGLVCGIIALSLYRKDKYIYYSDPASYEQSFKNAKAGYICGIVGVCVSGFMMLCVIFAILSDTGAI